MTSNSNRLALFLAIGLLFRVTALGQSEEKQTDQGTTQQQPSEGGSYLIHQSVEFGYRGSDVTGSQAMYNSLVNLPSGPRLLDQTLSMQSRVHDGVLFDNL